MERFVFGTQYLRGASPARSEWERDFDTIAALGFNTVRVWLVWGYLEPKEGEIDFESIETLLALAEKKSLRIIFLFHLHAIPEWAAARYRQYWYVGQDGRPFEPSARANTPSGGWPGLCPDHPEVQAMEERFLSEVTRRIGDRAFAFEPINEPHLWVDFTRQEGIFCYCDASRRAFRDYLKSKYGSLDALGDAWGKRFDCWESVRPPTWRFGFGDWVDFREFAMVNIAGLVERRAAVIRRHTSRPVIAHAWGGGSSCCGHLGAMPFDDWRNAGPVDSWGCSGFPDSIEATARLAQSMDSTRSAAAGKEFWQSELGASSYGDGNAFRTPPSPELFAVWCWESIFHGARGLLFWQFRPERFGNESGHLGLADRGGVPSVRAEKAAEIARTIARNETAFLEAEVPDAKVALLFSPRAFLLDWTMHRDNLFAGNALGGYYDVFYRRNIPVDILHAERIEPDALFRYKLVVLPAGITLSREQGELLTAYVEQGGNLLADPLTGSWDEAMRLSECVPGAGLRELFGVVEEHCRSGNRERITLRRGEKHFRLHAISSWETWRAVKDDVRPFAVNEAGEIVISERRAGGGRAFLSGVALGNLCTGTSGIGDDFREKDGNAKFIADAMELILSIAAEAGVAAPFDAPDALRLRSMRLPGGGELLLIANHSESEVEATIRSDSRRSRCCRCIYGGKELNFSETGEAQLTLPPLGSAVFLDSGSRPER